MRTIRRVSLIMTAIAIAATACSEQTPSAPDIAPLQPPPGMVVSNALSGSTIASLGSRNSSIATGAENAAYVSAVPGTFPQAFSVTIRNETRNAAPVTTAVLDGGFDPVGVVAAEDDELKLTFSVSGGGTTTMSVKVPRRRPPVVVRTNPPKGRTDVALSASITIIFSEPVDPATVTPSTVSLFLDSQPVGGSVQVAADGLSAVFVPAGQLASQQTYSLVISGGVKDQEGDSLADPVTVEFTTATSGTMIITTVTRAPSSEWLDGDGYIVSVAGQPDRAVAVNGTHTISGLVPATYDVSIRGVSETCTLDTPGPVRVSVLVGLPATVTFEVTCGPSSDLDGMIAFVSERDGNSEIYTVRSDGTGLVRLTNNAASDTDPAWSPDGTRILFASNRAGAAPGATDIYVMNADGSGVVRLTFGATASAPAWSPDGQKIVYSGVTNGQGGIFVTNLDNLSAATNVAHPIGYQVDPAWSPDGKKIAFTSDWRAYDFVYDLYVAHLDGSGITPLILGPFLSNPSKRFYFQPAWSPDGQRIAVVSCGYAWDNCYPNSTIVLADAEGNILSTLVQSAGFSRPAWSPDGKTIAYSTKACRECTGSLRYISADGSRMGLILSGGHSPAWRPR